MAKQNSETSDKDLERMLKGMGIEEPEKVLDFKSYHGLTRLPVELTAEQRNELQNAAQDFAVSGKLDSHPSLLGKANPPAQPPQQGAQSAPQGQPLGGGVELAQFGDDNVQAYYAGSGLQSIGMSIIDFITFVGRVRDLENRPKRDFITQESYDGIEKFKEQILAHGSYDPNFAETALRQIFPNLPPAASQLPGTGPQAPSGPVSASAFLDSSTTAGGAAQQQPGAPGNIAGGAPGSVDGAAGSGGGLEGKLAEASAQPQPKKEHAATDELFLQLLVETNFEGMSTTAAMKEAMRQQCKNLFDAIGDSNENTTGRKYLTDNELGRFKSFMKSVASSMPLGDALNVFGFQDYDIFINLNAGGQVFTPEAAAIEIARRTKRLRPNATAGDLAGMARTEVTRRSSYDTQHGRAEIGEYTIASAVQNITRQMQGGEVVEVNPFGIVDAIDFATGSFIRVEKVNVLKEGKTPGKIKLFLYKIAGKEIKIDPADLKEKIVRSRVEKGTIEKIVRGKRVKKTTGQDGKVIVTLEDVYAACLAADKTFVRINTGDPDLLFNEVIANNRYYNRTSTSGNITDTVLTTLKKLYDGFKDYILDAETILNFMGFVENVINLDSNPHRPPIWVANLIKDARADKEAGQAYQKSLADTPEHGFRRAGEIEKAVTSKEEEKGWFARLFGRGKKKAKQEEQPKPAGGDEEDPAEPLTVSFNAGVIRRLYSQNFEHGEIDEEIFRSNFCGAIDRNYGSHGRITQEAKDTVDSVLVDFKSGAVPFDELAAAHFPDIKFENLPKILYESSVDTEGRTPPKGTPAVRAPAARARAKPPAQAPHKPVRQPAPPRQPAQPAPAVDYDASEGCVKTLAELFAKIRKGYCHPGTSQLWTPDEMREGFEKYAVIPRARPVFKDGSLAGIEFNVDENDTDYATGDAWRSGEEKLIPIDSQDFEVFVSSLYTDEKETESFRSFADMYADAVAPLSFKLEGSGESASLVTIVFDGTRHIHPLLAELIKQGYEAATAKPAEEPEERETTPAHANLVNVQLEEIRKRCYEFVLGPAKENRVEQSALNEKIDYLLKNVGVEGIYSPVEGVYMVNPDNRDNVLDDISEKCLALYSGDGKRHTTSTISIPVILDASVLNRYKPAMHFDQALVDLVNEDFTGYGGPINENELQSFISHGKLARSNGLVNGPALYAALANSTKWVNKQREIERIEGVMAKVAEERKVLEKRLEDVTGLMGNPDDPQMRAALDLLIKKAKESYNGTDIHGQPLNLKNPYDRKRQEANEKYRGLIDKPGAKPLEIALAYTTRTLDEMDITRLEYIARSVWLKDQLRQAKAAKKLSDENLKENEEEMRKLLRTMDVYSDYGEPEEEGPSFISSVTQPIKRAAAIGAWGMLIAGAVAAIVKFREPLYEVYTSYMEQRNNEISSLKAETDAVDGRVIEFRKRYRESIKRARGE